MATQPQLSFIVRPEYYATITLESLISQVATSNLERPPLPQPILDLVQGSIGQNPPGQTSTQQLTQATTSSKVSRPWQRWYMAVYNWLLYGNGGGPLEIIAPSIDETDIAWFANGTIDDTTDPVTFTAALTGGSRFGIQFTITDPGTGYGSAPTVTVTDANGNTNGLVVTATVSSGFVDSLTVTTPGYGLVSPLTVAFSGGGGTGAAGAASLGRQWSVGDFILWNDPTITAGLYGYEIDQIAAIEYISATSATFTLTRRTQGGNAGLAQYGSPLVAHASKNFYRLINKGWYVSVDSALGPQLLKLFWDNMTVAALTVGQQGGSPILINLAPLPYLPGTMVPNTRLVPPSPGMRTMNGAAYCSLGIQGSISVNATSAARISAQAWESVRTVYAKVTSAPSGSVTFAGDTNACIVIYVCYISPAGVVGLLDVLVIDSGNFTSYSASNVPDGRQMPFHALGQWNRTAPLYDWPPNWLPVCAGALSGGGLLQLPVVPSGTNSVQFMPDGQIDFIVGQIGTSVPGGGLTVTVQT